MPRLATRVVAGRLGLLVAGGCAGAKPGPERTAEVPSSPVRQILPNGVRVIVQEHRASDVVALQLWIRAGARDEAPGELGLAHYPEHMLFKGTTTRPPRFVEREVEAVGGRIDAGTSLDFTFYPTVIPASQAAAGVRMLADIAVNASLASALLDTEKQVVLEEIRLGRTTRAGSWHAGPTSCWSPRIPTAVPSSAPPR